MTREDQKTKTWREESYMDGIDHMDASVQKSLTIMAAAAKVGGITQQRLSNRVWPIQIAQL